MNKNEAESGPRWKIEKGPNFMYDPNDEEAKAAHPCEEHIGRLELHRYETVLVGLTTTTIDPRSFRRSSRAYV